MRLQKYIAFCGAASRRKAEAYIKDGRVAVNGEIVTDMGVSVDGGDEILLDGKRLFVEEKKVYIILNKPKGYITSVQDQFKRKSVIDLISGIKERVYPVGRLDYDTSGLVILTNDGDFTYRVTHPSHNVEKVYIAKIAGVPTSSGIQKFEEGLKIDDYVTAKASLEIIKISNNICEIKITIHEGRNRQVRRMCEAIGHKVIELKRIRIGGIDIGDLKEGQWRCLNEEEIANLR